MIDKLAEFGKKLRSEDSHDAIKEEPIHMDIVINEKGDFIDFIPLAKGSKTISETILSKKGKARLLVDKVEETLCFDEVKQKLYIEKLESYKNILVLKPVLLFYDENKINGIDKAKEKYEEEYRELHEKLNITMHYVFRLVNDNKRLNEYKEVINEIKKRHEENQAKNKKGKICSICGKSDYPITDSPHGSIKQVPNGQSSGCALVSYNTNAFESYGLGGNFNSNICERCARDYTNGLNELLSSGQMIEPEGKGKPYKSYKYRKKLGNDAALLFWLRSGNNIEELKHLEEPKKYEDEFSWMEEESILTETRVDAFKILIDSLHKHDDKTYKNLEDDFFYSMIISGETSRILVRSWIETTSKKVKENILKWFYDIAIYSSYSKKVEIFPIYDLVNSVSKESYVTKKLYEYLWNTALFYKPLPLYVLKETINTVHSNIYSKGYVVKENVALLKLILNRLNTKKEGGFNMNAKCDEENRSVAYVAGRIFALYEQIQYSALGDVNAGIREKFFTSASTTPSRAFGRLANMCQKHISKLEKSGSVYYDKKLQELFGKIECFPTLFSLEEQGQFVIGYYHQKQEIYTKKEDKEIVENKENNNE